MLSNFTRSKSIRSAATALLAFCWLHPPVHAQQTTEHVLMSAPFGLAPDQSVRVTLFLPDGTPASGHVKVFDSSGNPVAESAEVRISGGGFHSFHFEPGDIQLAGEEGTGRREVRASCWVRVDGPWAGVHDPVATLEIIRVSSGVTDGTSNTFLVGERPPSRGEFGGNEFLVGIVPGQALRLSAFIPGAGSSLSEPVLMFAVTYSDGNVVAASREIEIPTGKFAWVDFNYRDLLVAAEQGTGRKQMRLRPFFRFTTRRENPTPALVTLEIVDETGTTLNGPQCLVFFLGGIPGD